MNNPKFDFCYFLILINRFPELFESFDAHKLRHRESDSFDSFIIALFFFQNPLLYPDLRVNILAYFFLYSWSSKNGVYLKQDSFISGIQGGYKTIKDTYLFFVRVPSTSKEAYDSNLISFLGAVLHCLNSVSKYISIISSPNFNPCEKILLGAYSIDDYELEVDFLKKIEEKYGYNLILEIQELYSYMNQPVYS
jgi:hypothetical protein